MMKVKMRALNFLFLNLEKIKYTTDIRKT